MIADKEIEGLYRYGFNGMEKDEELSLGIYATLWRMYDARIGRWSSLDPEMHKFPSSSPYSAMANNPIVLADIFGNCPACPAKGTFTDGENNFEYKESDNFTVGELEEWGLKPFVPEEYEKYVDFEADQGKFIVSDKNVGVLLPVKENLLDEWGMGKGATNRLFLDDHPMTQDMQNAYRVNKGRDFFYKKYSEQYKSGEGVAGGSVTNWDGAFGLTGLVMAGTDLTEQFVGSYRLDIYVAENGKDLIFKVTNSTNMESAGYRVLDSYPRNDNINSYYNRGAGGDTFQIYMWTEPIDPTKF